MKHTIFVWTMGLVLVLSAAALMITVQVGAQAQVPRTLSYQGILTNISGIVVEDGDYGITFHIYDVAAGGAPLWTEDQTVFVIKGIFNAILGLNEPLDLPFDRPYWIGIQVKGEAELSPRIELTASPYALGVAEGSAVTSINSLTDSVTIAAGENVSITPSGNTITISSTGTGSDGDWIIHGINMYSAVGGNVGIGTISPASDLHVSQVRDGGVGLRIENLHPGSSSCEYLEFADENGALAWMCNFDEGSSYGSAWIFANNRPGGYLRFHTGNAERMRIANTGEVGIGTAQPLAPLHVRNYDVQTPASALHSTDLVVESQDAVLGLYSAPSGSYGSCLSFGEVQGGALANKWSIIRQTTAGGNGLLFYFGPNADPVTNDNIVYLDDNGEVGVGTTNPGAKLEVAGQVKITGGSPGAGKVLTSDASGLASWEPVTAEYWFSPQQIIGTEIGGVEIEHTAEGYIKISRSSAAGWAVLYFYFDLPGKISGRQQRLQSVTFHYMMHEWSEWIRYIYVKRLNTDGTSTTIYSDTGLYLQEHSWSSYTCTDADPDPITGPISLRLDIQYSNPGAEFYVGLGSIKVVTTD